MVKTLRYEMGKKSFIGVIVIFEKSNNIVIWLQLQYWPFSFTHDTLTKLPVQKKNLNSVCLYFKQNMAFIVLAVLFIIGVTEKG